MLPQTFFVSKVFDPSEFPSTGPQVSVHEVCNELSVACEVLRLLVDTIKTDPVLRVCPSQKMDAAVGRAVEFLRGAE